MMLAIMTSNVYATNTTKDESLIVLIHTYGSEKIDEAVKHGSVQVDEYTTKTYSYQASMVRVETTPILLVRNDGSWKLEKGKTKVTEHITWWIAVLGIFIILMGFAIPYVYAKTKPIGKTAQVCLDILLFAGLLSLGLIHTIPALSIAGGIVVIVAIIIAILLKPGSAEMTMLVIWAILGCIFAYFLSIALAGSTYPIYAGSIGLGITILAVWSTGEASKKAKKIY